MHSSALTTNQVPPVLLITFNRPTQTAEVLQVIKAVQPAALYVSNDGPRQGRPEDDEKVGAVRKLVSDINWCKSVHTRFQPSNLGCANAVSEAISWFLDEVGEGIILEDDCLPDPTFFRFCAEMLERYRNATNVMQIVGYNLIADKYQMQSHYVLSNFGFIWGWATWQRAWKKFDLSMRTWSKFKQLGLQHSFPFYPERIRIFDAVSDGEIDTWDYQWQYAVTTHSGLSVVPRVNLVRNIGFGGGTHSKSAKGTERYAIPVRPMDFPLKHWEFLFPDMQYDRLFIREVHKRSFGEKIRIALSRIYRRMNPKQKPGYRKVLRMPALGD